MQRDLFFYDFDDNTRVIALPFGSNLKGFIFP